MHAEKPSLFASGRRAGGVSGRGNQVILDLMLMFPIVPLDLKLWLYRARQVNTDKRWWVVDAPKRQNSTEESVNICSLICKLAPGLQSMHLY